MLGVAILTEARSGSEWLGSLINQTGNMGQSRELVRDSLLSRTDGTFQSFRDAVLEVGTTSNDRFAVKIFPRHLRFTNDTYGADFLLDCRRRFPVRPILLERRDRLRQAISFCRAKQTDQWTSRVTDPGSTAHYDFAEICRAMFWLGESYAFWQSYVSAFAIEHDHFFYEDLIGEPHRFVEAVASALDVDPPAGLTTSLTVQRDSQTEDWVVRFREDAERQGILHELTDFPMPRTLANIRRFLTKTPMKARTINQR